VLSRNKLPTNVSILLMRLSALSIRKVLLTPLIGVMLGPMNSFREEFRAVYVAPGGGERS
jgi:hypothetical protein